MKKKIIACLITSVVIVLSISVTMVSGGATQPTQATRGDSANWLHFGYDSSYTAYNPIESTINITTISLLERKWGIFCDDGWSADNPRSPAIYNGKLYAHICTNPVSCNSKLRAYDARTGQMLWEFSKGYVGSLFQPVASEDGIIFGMEGSYPTYLYAVDADTGGELWETPIGFDLGYNVKAMVTVDEANGLVYIVEKPHVGYGKGKLFALDKQTGEIIWYKSKATDGVGFKGDYALLSAGKIFAVAELPDISDVYHVDHMLSINASSHETEVTFDRPEELHTTSYDIEQYTLCNNRLVVGFSYMPEYAKYLVGYDRDSPTIVWQKELSEEITGTIACNTTMNVIYVSTDPYLYALNATTGEEIWKYMGYGAIYNPSVANGIIYFLSDTNMYAIDDDTMELVFSYPLGGEADESTQVAICDGMLYFSGSGGTCDLYALGLPVPPIPLAFTTADACVALQIVVGSRGYDPLYDVSGDGYVTSLDVLMILQVAAGAINL